MMFSPRHKLDLTANKLHIKIIENSALYLDPFVLTYYATTDPSYTISRTHDEGPYGTKYVYALFSTSKRGLIQSRLI